MLGAWACVVLIGATSAAQEHGPTALASRAHEMAGEGRMVALGGLYGEQRIACVQCHGLDGAGDSSGAFPRLSGQSAWYLYKTLQDYASGLRTSSIMGPVARTLSDAQMQQVASHYATSVGAPTHAEGDPDIHMRQTGGAIAAAGIPAQGVPACNGCHGRDGHGAAPIYPALAGQFAAYTSHQLLLWKQGRRGGDPMNIMELIAKAMTDEQIEAVSAYYAAVAPPSSGQGQPPNASALQAPRAPDPASGKPQYPRGASVLGLAEPAAPNPPPPGAMPAKPAGAPNTETTHEPVR